MHHGSVPLKKASALQMYGAQAQRQVPRRYRGKTGRSRQFFCGYLTFRFLRAIVSASQTPFKGSKVLH
jgi:hypothetical protein